MKTTNKSLFSFTIFLAILGCFTSTQIAKVQAQVITPDNTLGSENSVVNTVENRDTINGGAPRGTNLFHSFQEFGIRSGREAYFTNPSGIQNILARVTGGNPSNILGTLGVSGSANLFLINPNGILFGPNARLDVGGSFFASTADSLVFGNGFEFSASNTLAPPLLTVNTPIGLRFRDNPGNITNQSVVLDNTNFAVGLQVKPGNSLALVGGDVIVEQGGRLTAAGGRIELGGLAGTGTVGLDVTGNTFKLNFPANSLLSNVSLADDARVSVLSNGGGDIAINANIFTATSGGRLLGGIEGTATKNGGDIVINSTDIFFDGFSSGIVSSVFENAEGNAGIINIKTGTFFLTNGAQIGTSTFGKGNAGSVKIQANDIFFDGVGSTGFSSGIISSVLPGAVGNAGDIDITSGRLYLKNSAFIGASTFGTGNAGTVKIQASDISLDGVGSTGFSSGIFSNVQGNAVGKAGGIDITTGKLSLTNGAVINASTFATGDGGRIKIQASDTVFASGVGTNRTASSIRNNVEEKATGNAGGIDISTKNLSFVNGAQITASTFSEGNAGSVTIKATEMSFDGVSSIDGFNSASGIVSSVFGDATGNGGGINITTETLYLKNGAQIGTATFNRGNAGTIKVQARDISFDGSGDNGSSGIFSTVQENATGNAGGIDIIAKSLFLKNGAIVTASTFSRGDAGRIKIQASDTIFADGTGNNKISSGIQNGVSENAIGNAGGIDIETKNLSFSNGAQINAVTFGRGNAGTVKIQASGIFFDGVGSTGFSSGVFSTVQGNAVGKAGGIDINTGKLSLTNGATINASTFAAGDGGRIKIQASDTIFASGVGVNNTFSSIQNNVQQKATGNAGGIDIETKNLSFSDGAQITASTYSRGNAGIIKILASDISFDALESKGFYTGISSSVEENAIGNAGGIDIKTGTLSLVNGAQIGASTFNRGNAGSVKIQANDISLNGVGSTGFSSGIFSGVAGKGIGNADGVDITTGKLSLINGAVISASTFGTGDAGRVKIQASDTIFADGVGNQSGSGIRSDVQTSAIGNAGGIDISTKNLFLSNGSQVTALTGGRGNAGNVKIQANDISIDGVGSNGLSSGIGSTVEQNALGNAGGIDIITRNLSIKNGAVVNASTFATGDAGKINIQASDTIFASGVGSAGFSSAIGSNVSQNAAGNAGGINIATGILSLQNGAIITASTFGRGNAGTVKVQARDISFDGVGSNGNFSGIFSNVQQGAIGNAGGIDIEAETLSLKNFAIINASTSGRGNAGGIVVRTGDVISLANSGQIRSGVEAGGEGNAGNIDIKGRSLTLTGGSQIGAFVFRKTNEIPGGIGTAGNITINTTDFVNISGVSVAEPSVTEAFGFSSGIFASAERGTTATTDKAAGNISIKTGNFRIADRAVVNAATSNTGNGGSISINANTFTATGGAQVITTTRNSGNAGDITLKVTDRITISGNDPNYKQRLEEASRFGDSTDIVNNQGAESGIFANTALGSTGNGGNIFIDPKVMVVSDGAGISGNSAGTGNAGNIEVLAGTLTLDKEGFITTASSNGQGGKITVTANDLLLLRRNSLISTSAGSGGPGSGGDIDINTGVLVAFPRENSDITANSFGGRGGNINIRTRGVFGIQVRPQQTELSDITATSLKDPQLSGQINLTNEVNPSQALIELPENVTNRTDQIARNPCQEGIGNEYIETGRGGLPTNPNQPLNSSVARVDLVNLAPNTGNTTASNTASLNNSTNKKIVPAQGWVMNERGQVVLIAYDPTGAGVQRTQQNTAVCPSR
jgi:filamentous hemagglutinin family protein